MRPRSLSRPAQIEPRQQDINQRDQRCTVWKPNCKASFVVPQIRLIAALAPWGRRRPYAGRGRLMASAELTKFGRLWIYLGRNRAACDAILHRFGRQLDHRCVGAAS